MVMVRYIILLTLLFLGATMSAQTTGSLQGKVIDVGSDEGLPFANIVLEKEGTQITGTQTDFDGNYNFSNVEAGTYDVIVSYIGFPTVKTEGVVISLGKVVRFDIEMEEGTDLLTDSSGVAMEIVVRGYRIPLIEQDATSGGQTLGSEDIKNLATRNVGSIVATTAGVNQADEGEAINSNGSRSTSNDTYIDGVRVIGNFGIPETEIDQVQIITSGVPAEFGDATGAITNIITKGPSSKLTVGVQLETSQYLDAFAANRADAYFSGPIIAKPMINSLGDTLKKNGKVRKSTILGYRFAGVYFTTLDDRPSALGSFKLKDDKLNEILATPLVQNPSGLGTVYSADFLTSDDLEPTFVRPNARTSYSVVNGKLDFKPNKDFYFVAGGQGQFNWGNFASTANRLFNYNYNPTTRSNTWRVSGRFRHSVSSTQPGGDDEVGDSTKTQSVFQNFSYELQGDYSQTNASNEDPRYNDRLWEYGYVGKYYQDRIPVFQAVDSVPQTNSIGDTIGWEVNQGHAAFFNQFYAYEPNLDINPGLASYNNLVADQVGPTDFTGPNSFFGIPLDAMEIVNGLNSGARTSIYGLFNSPHQLGSGYGKSNSSQVRANVRVNFDLVMGQKSGNPIRHSILMGGTFEQRVQRSYNINPFSLWNVASQTVNSHISNAADPNRPTGEVYFDPFTQRQYDLYESLIRTDEEGNEVEMSLFGQRLRESLGLNKRDWVSIHEITPDQMELEWFEPSTIITGNNQLVSYYGYDYLGNPSGTDIDFFSFFNETQTLSDGRVIKTRPIAPNKPIYVAGFFQDKFTYKDIICNLGVRFDSYDANTKVLNDPYSIVGYESADQFESSSSIYAFGQSSSYSRPSNIGDDFAVYVNDNNKDASVIGYRDGEQWYDATGLPVNTPGELGSTFVPALTGFGSSKIDPKGEEYRPEDAFRDYLPTLIVMPRIAFSFPISKEANFYANYDVLSQRPPEGALATPLTYYNFQELSTNNFIGNPNLKPQRTINYEVGYQQKLTDFSKFKLSILYREERDLIQIREYIRAYPNTYSTFGNSDFSTTKAFKLEYDMRENNNLRVLANYTLAFSEGTGSSPTSSSGVAAKELKYVFPLAFDQRHTFYLMFDYRFKSGVKYNGPKIGKFDVLENTGINLAFNVNSGRPYTRKEIPGGIGTSFSNRITDGSINGARMDWTFRVDLKFDRDIVIGAKSANPIRVNIYVRIQNLLNTQNPLGVYAVTGSPTDDGFLTLAGSPGPGFASSQPASYPLLYDLRMNNPYNISRPRRIFLGLKFSF
jgi:hypothetical protein